MSFAPRDTHEAQVQFALERGVPAMIGIMASQRLPYPARAFDMAHCSRCLIPWQKYGTPEQSLHSFIAGRKEEEKKKVKKKKKRNRNSLGNSFNVLVFIFWQTECI